MHSSPATPAGTGRRPRSSSRMRWLAIGRPIGGSAGQPPGSPRRTKAVVSVGLRRSVLVEQPGAPRAERGDRGGDPQLLAGGDQLAQGRRRPPLLARRLGELLQGHEGLEQALDPPSREEGEQGVGVAPHLLRHQHQGPPRPPGGEHLLEGDVEAERRELEDPPAALRPRRAGPGGHVDQRPVGQRHPLGPAGGAGGVKDVGQVIGIQAGTRTGRGGRLGRLAALVEDDHLQAVQKPRPAARRAPPPRRGSPAGRRRRSSAPGAPRDRWGRAAGRLPRPRARPARRPAGRGSGRPRAPPARPAPPRPRAGPPRGAAPAPPARRSSAAPRHARPPPRRASAPPAARRCRGRGGAR